MTASSLMLVAKPAHAETTFTVTNTADPGDGICSPGGSTLREAITAANNTPAPTESISISALSPK